MLYEARTEPMLSRRQFYLRVGWHLLAVAAIAVGSLLGGMLGYHRLAAMGWTDSFLNASMILSGMGPVDRLPNSASKLFASLYALFSGLVFIGVMGIVLAPWLHRIMHRFHAERRRE